MQRAAITVPEPDPRERALAHSTGLPDLVARVLLSRGFEDPAAIRDHMKPDLRRLHSPFEFTQMRRAVDRVREAVRNGEKIMIHGDYDADGISGTVLLTKFLRLMDVAVHPHIPARADGYSFSERSLEVAAEVGAGLVISVDNGTGAVGPIRALQARGVDVIVTDHHGTSDEPVADAFAVLNPRLPDAGYPDRELAGVGMAFKLACAVAESFSRGRKQGPEMATFLRDALAYVAIGSVADVAPMRGENRIMVSHGLRSLIASPDPGIKALLDIAGVRRREATAEDISFRIAPLINAAGRVGSAREAVELFLAPGLAEAQEKAANLAVRNAQRRKVEKGISEQVMALAEEQGNQPAIVLAGDDWHHGVLGIVASRLVDKTGKPAVLIGFPEAPSDDPARSRTGRGSARAPNGWHLRDCLAAVSEHLETYGGHAAAAGMEVRRDRFPLFQQALWDHLNANQPEAQPVTTDGGASLNELEPRALQRLNQLGPFGQGNRRPTFASGPVKIVGQPAVDARGRDLRLRVAADGVVLPARWPRQAERFEELRNLDRPVRIAYSPRINTYGDEGPIQLVLHHLEVAD